MDIFTIDEDYDRFEIVDEYVSLVWTERLFSYGDFELLLRSDRKYRQILPLDTFLQIPKSEAVMQIETHEDYSDDEGRRYLKMTGRSIEARFMDRTAMPSLEGFDTLPTFELTGTPTEIVRDLLTMVYLDKPIDSNDTFPYLVTWGGEIFAGNGNLPAPTEEITMEFKPGSLYDALQQICIPYNIGVAAQDWADAGVRFYVNPGSDRTSQQTSLVPVIFSEDMDNMSNGKTLMSRANYKNVAYVYAANGSGIVYGPEVDSSVSGDRKRILTVDASDIELPAGASLDLAIQQRGQEELAKHNTVFAFDAEVPQHSPYDYKFNGFGPNRSQYGLGDLVEQRSRDGYSSRMRIIEQIFISDEEGDRSYPTLQVDTVATPGSWAARPSDEVWNTVPTEEVWADL